MIIQSTFSKADRKQQTDLKDFSLVQAHQVLQFHQSFPEYSMTPLVNCNSLAAKLGIKNLSVKDESKRFGLNAFKVLGGSYAIGRLCASRLGLSQDQVTCELLTAPGTKRDLGNLTFVTATDGNHGRGIAWTAARLGMSSVVYMPMGTAEERLKNIQALGANAGIMDMNYDDCVRLAARMAKENGWILVQDTSVPDDITTPLYIMQGYMTMALEACEQLSQPPTHVFLQAGVGAMAGAVTAFMANRFGKLKPKIIIVEPDAANCIYQTAMADDGTLHNVTGNLSTMMAGLACGEPCSIGWNILRDYADAYFSVPDSIAALGMRLLGRPLDGDSAVVSGESGAVTTGLVYKLMTDPSLEHERIVLGLNETSRILCFSTEGDTDKENYRRIVMD